MSLELSNDGFANTDIPRWDTWSPGLVQLLERDRGKFLRVAWRVAGSHEEAEDVVQDSALKALANLPRFRSESQLGTWFYSIVRNAAIDCLRKRNRQWHESLDDNIEGVRFEREFDRITYTDPEESYAREELRWIVLSEIAQLKPAHRAVIELFYIEGHSYIEAAKILNVSVNTVKARLYRGTKALRYRLYERTATSSVFRSLPPHCAAERGSTGLRGFKARPRRTGLKPYEISNQSWGSKPGGGVPKIETYCTPHQLRPPVS